MSTAKAKSKPIKLNTTAYCLLGLIDLKPQSAYDITKFLERSMLKYSLPRTPSQLYNEPKKLANLGLVKAKTETRQGRERTVYYIAPKGQRLLSEWLSEPGEAAKLEFKSMLKFYLASASNPQALRDRVEEIKQQTLQEIREVHAQISRFTSKGVILKEVAINAALTSRFAVGQVKARLEWVDEMESLLAKLSEDVEPESWAIEVYRESQRDLKDLIDGYLGDGS